MGKVINMKAKKLDNKKIIIYTIIALIVIALIIVTVVYNSNKNFRNFMDKYIFFKDVSEENLPIIEIDYNSNTNVIPYGKNICVLKENTLTQYDLSGKAENIW